MPPTLTPQHLIDAITLRGVAPVGTPNPDLYNPRVTESSANVPHSSRLTPGTVEIFNGSKYAAGFGPWIEVSSMNRTVVAAKLDLVGHLYSLSKSTGKWTERVAWGGPLGWAAHLFSWGKQHGACTDGPAHGWGSRSSSGMTFGGDDFDPQVPAGQAFVRVHGWPMSWTGTNGFFWTSVDPNSDKSPADMAKLNDLAGLVAVVEVKVTGTGASSARYAISHGWDTYWQGLATTGLSAGERTGTASGFREVKDGFECGMSLEGYNDIGEGDVIEAYEVEEVARTI